MMRKYLIAMLMVATIAPASALAQKKSKKKKEEPVEAKEEKKEKSIEEITKSCKAIPGLFTVYQDTINGSVYMEVAEAQLNKEFIHFSQIIDVYKRQIQIHFL